jgi:hypothetical protein
VFTSLFETLVSEYRIEEYVGDKSFILVPGPLGPGGIKSASAALPVIAKPKASAPQIPISLLRISKHPNKITNKRCAMLLVPPALVEYYYVSIGAVVNEQVAAATDIISTVANPHPFACSFTFRQA